MESKKRKREESVPVPPLITYHAPGRTFERLFNGQSSLVAASSATAHDTFTEKTLEDTKRVVRGKLGLDNNVHITLEQIREGRTIDLEDGTLSLRLSFSVLTPTITTRRRRFCSPSRSGAIRACSRSESYRDPSLCRRPRRKSPKYNPSSWT